MPATITSATSEACPSCSGEGRVPVITIGRSGASGPNSGRVVVEVEPPASPPRCGGTAAGPVATLAACWAALVLGGPVAARPARSRRRPAPRRPRCAGPRTRLCPQARRARPTRRRRAAAPSMLEIMFDTHPRTIHRGGPLVGGVEGVDVGVLEQVRQQLAHRATVATGPTGHRPRRRTGRLVHNVRRLSTRNTQDVPSFVPQGNLRRVTTSTGLRHERSEWWLAFLVLGWQDDSLEDRGLAVDARCWAWVGGDLPLTCSFVSQHPAVQASRKNPRNLAATVDKLVITVV